MPGFDEGAAGGDVDQRDFVAWPHPSTDDAVRFNSDTPMTAAAIGRNVRHAGFH